MTIKSIELTRKQWEQIFPKMMEQHGKSIAISWVMRRKLGFVRRTKLYGRGDCYIDFWEEKYKTAFILKYL